MFEQDGVTETVHHQVGAQLYHAVATIGQLDYQIADQWLLGQVHIVGQQFFQHGRVGLLRVRFGGQVVPGKIVVVQLGAEALPVLPGGRVRFESGAQGVHLLAHGSDGLFQQGRLQIAVEFDHIAQVVMKIAAFLTDGQADFLLSGAQWAD